MGESNRALLIAIGKNSPPEVIEEHLDELAFLAETLGIETMGRVVQNLPNPDSRHYVGKGKFAEIKNRAFKDQLSAIIFDDDLTPSQLRNIEKELNPSDREEKVRVYDRSLLILDIFLK